MTLTKKEVAWVDKKGKQYAMNEIKDSHLLNIISFMCRGGGYVSFLDTEKISNLFTEAASRNLKHHHNQQNAISIINHKRNRLNWDDPEMMIGLDEW
jgi:methyltransferase-like protein